ncbi:sodium-translocating pyrophosphatase, partial [Candidatus Bathyarchaeota archaeon]
FKTAFYSGSIMGLTLAGIGLLGVTVLYLLAGENPAQIVGLGFGASLTALFARVGGGIFTKAADMGADLVGKVEKRIPEDDPRNPAVIADQVGDNVGDIAGTGADVFQSYICTLIAAILVGFQEGMKSGGLQKALEWSFFPIAVMAVGIFASIFALLFVRVERDRPVIVIDQGIFATSVFTALASFFIANFVFEGNLNPFYIILIGLATVFLFAFFTEYYTLHNYSPVKAIARSSRTGAATNILMGLAVGLESVAIPIIIFCIAVFLSYQIMGLFGISLLAIGFLSITATVMSMSAYGPIVDNAQGIIKMAHIKDKRAYENAHVLDSIGNTAKAICKSYAVGASGLAQVALFSAFVEAASLSSIDLMKPQVIVGLIVGGMTTFLFSSFLFKAVGRAAFEMIAEVRRQFKTIAGLSKGEADPDYVKCIDISSKSALKGLFAPAIISIAAPLIVGFAFGAEAVGGFIAGNIATVLPMALLMMNSGTAWDNAKKYIETGELDGKGTATHASAVIGDTIGDPFKDTAGPSLDILINVIGSIALLFAALF